MCGITKKMKSLKHEKTTGSGERSLTFICFSAASKERCFSASSLRQQQLSRHRKKTKKKKKHWRECSLEKKKNGDTGVMNYTKVVRGFATLNIIKNCINYICSPFSIMVQSNPFTTDSWHAG